MASGNYDFPRRRILVDFDGTLGSMSFPSVPSRPFEQAAEVVRELHARGYEIVIFTTRAWPGWDQVDGAEQTKVYYDEMVEFLRRHRIPYHSITHEKMPCMFIIDDRSLNPGFHGWERIRQIVLDADESDSYGKQDLRKKVEDVKD